MTVIQRHADTTATPTTADTQTGQEDTAVCSWPCLRVRGG